MSFNKPEHTVVNGMVLEYLQAENENYRQKIVTHEQQIRDLQEENLGLRQCLWLLHPDPIGMKYGDDGEMQLQGIDFKRQPAEEIIQATTKALQKRWGDLQAQVEQWQQSAVKSYVTDCVISGRQDDGALFEQTNHGLIIRLNKYAIVPLEDYKKLQQELRCYREGSKDE